MKNHARKHRHLFTTILALSSMAGITVARANAQSSEGAFSWLTPESLQTLSTHLPSYMSAIQTQAVYQSKVPFHQVLQVKWSPAEGGSEASARFSLVKRQTHIANAPVNGQVDLVSRPVLAIATTPGGEVRGLALYPDTRETSGEFNLQLPQDGQVSKIIFASVGEGKGLTRIGELDLGLPDGAWVVARKRIEFHKHTSTQPN